MNLKDKPFYLNFEQINWVNETLSSLNTLDKVRQMFCFLGDSTSKEHLDEITEKGIGGILFRPVRTSKEIKEHFEKLDKISKIPLLHAANLEEGGAGGALDGTYFSSQLGIAATNNITDCRHFARVCANEGIKASINWTFSPVSDIDMNYLNPITNCRTYGSDTKKVCKFTKEFVKTYQSYGIASCAKHFPGDGVDYRDQHLHPTYNSLTSSKWHKTYGKVYKNLIDEGLLSIMVGHILAPALEMEKTRGLSFDDCLPASLSKGLLTGLLRGELGFNGLITTDATIMGGFTMPISRKLAIPMVFASGCDMIVFTTDLDEDINYALEGIENGLLTIDRVNEAVTRILALKAKVCGFKTPKAIPVKKWQKECADHAVTLVKNNSNILPINKNKYRDIRLMFLGNDSCNDGSITALFVKELENKGFNVEKYNPFLDDLHGTKNLPKNRLTITILNYPPASNQTTVRVNFCPKHALEIPRFVNEEDYIFISLANPYHLQDVPRTKVMINAYTANEAIIKAIVEKLCGESSFKGINPVDPYCGLLDTRL